MPETIYLFDIDGTLTPHRQPIKEGFADVFLNWVRSNNKKVYLVTGSDIGKISLLHRPVRGHLYVLRECLLFQRKKGV